MFQGDSNKLLIEMRGTNRPVFGFQDGENIFECPNDYFSVRLKMLCDWGGAVALQCNPRIPHWVSSMDDDDLHEIHVRYSIRILLYCN